jgi:Cu-processing system permease protein
MKKIIKYVIIDILRNKIVLAYTGFLLLLSFSIFNLEDNSAKGLLSLLNIILIIVLLVSQPLKRRTIWLSIFAGLACSLSLAFFIGVGIPVLIYEFTATGLIMLLVGLLLSVIFVAIAMLATVKTRDKAKGIGVSILLWLYFSLLFDGLVLFLLFQFADYPLEKAMIGVSAFNPIDLGRILVLLKMDVSALMGYTGAIFKDFFGTTAGFIISLMVLILWIVIPAWLSTRKFNRKDL